MQNFKFLAILLLISFIAVSCKTKKKLEKKRVFELNEVYDNITKEYINYNTLLIKASAKFDEGKRKIGLKTTIKIKKNKLIIISLSPGLGIELARIKFTNDSVFIIDRLSSQVTKGSYKFFNEKYKINVGFNEIQSILTNELFIYPLKIGADIKNEFVNNYVIRNKEQYIDLYRKTNELLENLIVIENKKNSIKNCVINDIKNRRNLTIKFEDYFGASFNNLPKRIYINSMVENKNIIIKLNYSKITKNKKLNFSFRIPSKYKTIIY